MRGYVVIQVSLSTFHLDAISCFFFLYSFQDSESDSTSVVASLIEDSLHTCGSAGSDDDDERSAAANVAVDKEKGSKSRDIASLTIDVRSAKQLVLVELCKVGYICNKLTIEDIRRVIAVGKESLLPVLAITVDCKKL